MRRILAAALIAGSLTSGSAAINAGQFRPGRPMRIVLLVDSSSAVSTMINQFRDALRIFVDALPGDPEIALVTTGGQLRIRVAPTDDRVKVRAGIASFAPDGGGNVFLDSLLEADKRLLKTAVGRSSVFVIVTTDMSTARAEVRTDSFNRFVKEYVLRGGRAHAVVVQGVTPGITTRMAENLAENTGGFYQTVQIANALPKLMATVADYVAADQ
jgi:hypothetical protein